MADNFIETISGRAFSFDSPTTNQVDIADVAHALSMQCRFAGHVKQFYSVAEHSVLVSIEVSRLGGNIIDTLAGLLHDAGEAFVGDMPSPVKHRSGMASYRDLEDAALIAVITSLGLGRGYTDLLVSATGSEIIRRADRSVTLAERNALLNHATAHRWEYDGVYEPSWLPIEGWQPGLARDRFQRRYDVLMEVAEVAESPWDQKKAASRDLNSIWDRAVAAGDALQPIDRSGIQESLRQIEAMQREQSDGK